TSAAYLLSALNVLNEGEINYRGARNKRLHVEMIIIRLCYLQQAIELSQNEGDLSKKKVVSTATAFRNISIVPYRGHRQTRSDKQSNATLVIEQPALKKVEEKVSAPEINEKISYQPAPKNNYTGEIGPVSGELQEPAPKKIGSLSLD